MNSKSIRRAAIGILLISLAGFFFGGSLPIPLMGKFFLGAFGFGSGAALLIVAKVLRVREHDGQMPVVPEDDESDNETEE